jgi:hypothetical protein
MVSTFHFTIFKFQCPLSNQCSSMPTIYEVGIASSSSLAGKCRRKVVQSYECNTHFQSCLSATIDWIFCRQCRPNKYQIRLTAEPWVQAALVIGKAFIGPNIASNEITIKFRSFMAHPENPSYKRVSFSSIQLLEQSYNPSSYNSFIMKLSIIIASGLAAFVSARKLPRQVELHFPAY